MKLFGFSFFDKITPLLEKGERYLEQGELDLALIQFKQVLKIDPGNQKAKEKLKQIYREKDTLKAVYAMTEKVEAAQKEKAEAQEAVEMKKSDRRQYPRAPDDRTVYYRVLKGSENAQAQNLNISASGMYLAVREPVPVGSFLELKFDLPPPERPVYAIGRVVRTEEREEDGKVIYGLGIKFTNISPEDQKRIHDFVEKRL